MKRKNAKIIIGDIYNDIAQVVMCEAYHLKVSKLMLLYHFILRLAHWAGVEEYAQNIRLHVSMLVRSVSTDTSVELPLETSGGVQSTNS